MVARVTIASTTQDVTCIYARRGKNRIDYRVVDEYGGGSFRGRSTRTSTQPLTLGDLVSFFNGAWSIFNVLEANFGHTGYDLEEMQDFIVGVVKSDAFRLKKVMEQADSGAKGASAPGVR